MVEAFRLPGEAQQIDRVVSSFAEWYMTTSPAQIADKDAAYVFSYSIIMLNTDLVIKKNSLIFHQEGSRCCDSTTKTTSTAA